MEEVIVILGPTCSGKTSLSIDIASRIDSEIISADSRQIFKHLNIGTAKPEKSDLEKVKHHFISEINPDGNFNVSIFAKKTEEIIVRLLNKKRIPLIVGGSGLYVKALIDGITESADTNNEIRTELLELRQKFGNDYLYNELKKIDKVSAGKMLPQNWKRVIRALEVFRLTGKTIWQHHDSEVKINKFNFSQIGLIWEREQLYKNIEARVDEMIHSGLVEEVEDILKLNYTKSLNSLNTVGYKEIIQYLEKEISLERAIELIKRNTRRYAKRQITWFNADKRIKWYNIASSKDLKDLSEKIVKDINERKN